MTSSIKNNSGNNIKAVANEYLTFWLGQEYYGIDILTVQEIRTYGQVTAIANMPAYIKGVMNLRGVVIPIVDMRIKFKLSDITYHDMTVVIILNIDERIVGIVVDSVADVLLLDTVDVQPPPDFASALDTKYIKGLASQNELMLILIHINKLMSSQDMALFNQIETDSSPAHETKKGHDHEQ
ncbi:chemotaxis protein CheW [Vibrio sp. ZSDZ65]|uniref:Chemotaxis protein CheW n=1 Tax=Vibrio qingdaonensis TaxID=2829491 RepID=A0A9X3CPI7_9VIBR|nr:chemotaxis protein CheW [Vibrio qingdaonensis]MCW8347144.1 chemotaxis protein CheW [Vibrio qingdaonensis]